MTCVTSPNAESFSFARSKNSGWGKRGAKHDLHHNFHYLWISVMLKNRTIALLFVMKTCQETDLGVTVDNTLKPTHHCNKASSRCMFALKQLKVTFGTISSNNFKPLYNAFVRPHIEYCAQAVGPYMVQNFKSLEKVQWRATKLVQGMRNVPYEERLSRLGMTSVEERLQRGDFIMTYKMLTGKVKLDLEHFFERSQEERTRGHHLRLTKKRARLHARGDFFSHRVMSPWNALPEEVVSAATTNSFKNRLDHWTTRNEQQSWPIQKWTPNRPCLLQSITNTYTHTYTYDITSVIVTVHPLDGVDDIRRRSTLLHIWHGFFTHSLMQNILQLRWLLEIQDCMHGWRMPYGKCGCCHTNFDCAIPTFCPFIIIGHSNSDLLVNHIMFWPHQQFENHPPPMSPWLHVIGAGHVWCHSIVIYAN